VSIISYPYAFVRPRIVDIRRIAIETYPCRHKAKMISFAGTILNLHTHQPHCDVRQVFNRSEPTGTTPDIPARLVFLQFAHLPREPFGQDLCELDALVCRKVLHVQPGPPPGQDSCHRLVNSSRAKGVSPIFSTSSSLLSRSTRKKLATSPSISCTSPRVKVPIQETAAELRMARSSDGTLVGEEGANSDD